MTAKAKIASTIRRFLAAVLFAWRWCRDRLVSCVAAIVLALSVIALVKELLGQEEVNTARVVSLAVLALLASMLCQHATDLIQRMKKLAWLELYERQGGFLTALEGHSASLKAQLGKFASHALSRRDLHNFRRGDLFLSVLDFSGISPSTDDQRRQYTDMLWAIAHVAFSQKDWLTAEDRLQRFKSMSKTPEDHALPYSLGLLYFSWAVDLDPKDAERAAHFRTAAEHLGKATKKNPGDHEGHYYLAFVQDELGDYGAAVESNERALRIRPQYAPAKYNAAVSWLKSGDAARSFQALQRISRSDEGLDRVLATIDGDPELEGLRTDATYGPQVKALVATWR